MFLIHQAGKRIALLGANGSGNRRFFVCSTASFADSGHVSFRRVLKLLGFVEDEFAFDFDAAWDWCFRIPRSSFSIRQCSMKLLSRRCSCAGLRASCGRVSAVLDLCRSDSCKPAAAPAFGRREEASGARLGLVLDRKSCCWMSRPQVWIRVAGVRSSICDRLGDGARTVILLTTLDWWRTS